MTKISNGMLCVQEGNARDKGIKAATTNLMTLSLSLCLWTKMELKSSFICPSSMVFSAPRDLSSCMYVAHSAVQAHFKKVFGPNQAHKVLQEGQSADKSSREHTEKSTIPMR